MKYKVTKYSSGTIMSVLDNGKPRKSDSCKIQEVVEADNGVDAIEIFNNERCVCQETFKEQK